MYSARVAAIGKATPLDWITAYWWLFPWGLLAFLLLPVAFLCLPVSMRRAKVRWEHIIRITIYGLFIPASIGCAICSCLLLAYISYGLRNVALPLATILILYVLFPAIVLWWGFAIRRYLKLAHGWYVAILLATIAVLLPMTVAVGLCSLTGSPNIFG